MTEGKTELALWLDSIIGKDKDYRSNVEVAALTGLAEGTIRNMRKGVRPGRGSIEKLADGLPYSRMFILLKAGILSEKEVRALWIETLFDIFSRLPESGREVLIKTGQALLEAHAEKSNKVPTKE